MRLLVSACLLGCACRYDGGAQPCQVVLDLAEEHELIPVCPEQWGGLPTPRPAAERRGDRVVNREGADVTAAFEKGAAEVLRICRLLHADGAVLKARSPSCGKGQVYDGSFTGALVPGNGVAAQLLLDHGFPVWTEAETDAIID